MTNTEDPENKRRKIIVALLDLEIVVIFYLSKVVKTKKEQKLLRERLKTVALCKKVFTGEYEKKTTWLSKFPLTLYILEKIGEKIGMGE